MSLQSELVSGTSFTRVFRFAFAFVSLVWALVSLLGWGIFTTSYYYQDGGNHE